MRRSNKGMVILLAGLFTLLALPESALAADQQLNYITGYQEYIPAAGPIIDNTKNPEVKPLDTEDKTETSAETAAAAEETETAAATETTETAADSTAAGDAANTTETTGTESTAEPAGTAAGDKTPETAETTENKTDTTTVNTNITNGNITTIAGEQAYKGRSPISVSSSIPNTTMGKDANKYNAVYDSAANTTRFQNYVDGYSVTLPGNIEVTNMNLSGLCAVLSDGTRHIEIYREDFNSSDEVQSYLSYSYRGVDSSSADEKILKTTETINGRNVQIYKWRRNILSGIQNDANYYTSLDFIDGNTVYNIFIKTQSPIEECGGFEDILNSFAVGPRTQLGTDQILQNSLPRSWNEETEAFYKANFTDSENLNWGIFEPTAPQDMTTLNRKESELNYEFPVLLYYTHIHHEYEDYRVSDVLEKAYAEGRTLELTLQTNSDSEAVEGNMVYQVLNGSYDTFLHKYAAAIAEFGHPVMFRLGNEMNGDWCPYSAYYTSRDTAVYRAFYRYVYEIFRSEGALNNTIWIWNPNEKSYPNYKWNYETLYYPGDAYVDVVGITGYNTGTYYASSGETWRSFEEIYDPIYNKVTSYTSKPIMITEFACSSIGGDKAQWVIDMFNALKKYPKIKIAVWWDGRDLAANGEEARPYYINDNAGAAMAFRAGFNGGVTEYGLVLY